MEPADFVNPGTGKLVEIQNGFQAFVPAPVPRDLSLPSRLTKLLGDTRAELGRLDEGVQTLPTPDLFLRVFQKREAVLSSRIEGTVTTLDEALLADAVEAEPVDDALEVHNYEEALRIGVMAMKEGRTLNVTLLRSLHQVLLTGVRGAEKRPGEFREGQAYVARGTVSVPGDARFVPPPAVMLPDCLDDLDRYLAERGAEEGLVRIALAHYQFETIHPFADGNGRTGRLLAALQMVWEGVLGLPFVYVSPVLERRRQDYYDGLLRVSQRGAFLEWIEFFVTAMKDATAETLDRIGRLRALAREFERMLLKQLSTKPLHLAKHLFSSPYVTVSLAKRILDVPQAATAQQTIDKLVDAGILTRMDYRPKGARGRPPQLYRCPAILDIIRE